MKKTNMKKILIPVIGFSLVFTTTVPFNAVLADEVPQVVSMENSVDNGEFVFTQENQNTYSIFDKKSDKNDVIRFNKGYTSAMIFNDDGYPHKRCAG